MNPPRSQTPMSAQSLESYGEQQSVDSKSVQVSSSVMSGDFEKKSVNNVVSNEQRSMFSKLANASNRFLSKKFRAFGVKVGSHPFRVIVFSVILAALCASGVMRLTNENRSEKLWVPGDTRAQDDRVFVDDNYGGEARFGSIVLKPKTGTNAYTKETLDALHAFRSKIEEEAFVEYDGKNITWGGAYWVVDKDVTNADTPDAAGMKYSKTDKEEWQCYRYSKSCAMSSILGVFENNPTNWDTQAKINAKLTADVLKDEENCATSNGLKHSDSNACTVTAGVINGPDIYLNQTSGHPTLTSEGHYTATSVTLQFLMKNFEVVKDGNKVDDRGDAFEDKVLEIIRNLEEEYSATVSVEYAVSRSFGDEFGAAINGDILKLQIAFILILSYATFMLSKGGEGCVGSRVFISGMGVLSIGLAIASSYGLCSYFGLFYSPLMNVLPFLLLGIGVDDMFVLVNAYDNTNPYLSVAERLGNALSTAGMSITVTSFTDIFAFLIGSSTSLPALRNFCFYAACGILFDYLYQLTFFAAFLAIDERRRMQKKGDCFCCPTCDEGATCCIPCCKPAAGAPVVVVVVNGVEQEQVGRERMTKRVMGALADFLTNKIVKVVVLVVFAGIAAGGIAGVSKIKVEADVMDFLPPGYLRDWVSTLDDEFSRGRGIEVYTTSEFDVAADYALGSDSVLKKTAAAFKANQYVQDESVDAWTDTFEIYVGMCENSGMPEAWKTINCVDASAASGNTFNDKVYKFVTTPTSPGGYVYASDIKFDTNTTPPTIIATRIRATQVEGQNTAATIEAMDSIRATIDSIPGNEQGYIFAYNEDFLNVEQYKSIDKEAIRNVSLTLLVCFVVIALLIVDPLTVSCVFINLLLIVINILGYMQAWGLNIDSVTVIMLVIALGLAVDYSAHIGRNFLEKHGDPNDRMRMTLRDMGVAVFHGAMSTMVAVLVLGSSDSYVFMTFFKQLFLCISLGLAHGLILLPVCLTLCNPNPYDELEDDF